MGIELLLRKIRIRYFPQVVQPLQESLFSSERRDICLVISISVILWCKSKLSLPSAPPKIQMKCNCTKAIRNPSFNSLHFNWSKVSSYLGRDRACLDEKWQNGWHSVKDDKNTGHQGRLVPLFIHRRSNWLVLLKVIKDTTTNSGGTTKMELINIGL